MRLAFFDPAGLDYTVETPLRKPLGGSQSAICYLAVELARIGVSVAVINATTTPGTYLGVECPGPDRGGDVAYLNGFDVIVVQNAAIGSRLRDARVAPQLVLWTQHATDVGAMQALGQPAEQAAWNACVFVSEWQRAAYLGAFGWAGRDGGTVIRNAASPAFIDAIPGSFWIDAGRPPELVYTSTPFRGLDVLVAAFPMIRRAEPEARLTIFSSMSTYQVREANDTYAPLYRKAQALPGVAYVGALGQADLAARMSGAAMLAYPSTFAETSCIAVIEALAAGARVVTTRLGALEETSAGFARLLEPAGRREDLVAPFAAAVIDDIADARKNPAEARQRRIDQMSFARSTCSWRARAPEWSAYLAGFVGRGI